MKISVVVPTFKPKLNLLSQLFESLELQTLLKHFFEVVVVENGVSNNEIPSLLGRYNFPHTYYSTIFTILEHGTCMF